MMVFEGFASYSTSDEWDTHSPRLVSCESSRFGLSVASFLTCFFFSIQCDQKVADNFEAVDLSWIKNVTDPLEVLKQGSDFLEDPLKISVNNRERWCNLHVTPALRGIIVEVCSLEEVAYWAKKGRLGLPQTPRHLDWLT